MHRFFNAAKVGERELGVDHFDVINRRNFARNMHHVIVVKAAHDMSRGVAFADVGEKLVAQPFALRRAFDEAGNIHKLHRRGNHALRNDDGRERRQACVGYFYDAAVGLDGAERIVFRRDARFGERVKERGFADVREADDAALDCHDGAVFE